MTKLMKKEKLNYSGGENVVRTAVLSPTRFERVVADLDLTMAVTSQGGAGPAAGGSPPLSNPSGTVNESLPWRDQVLESEAPECHAS